MSQDVNMIQALNAALHDAMAADPRVIALGEEVGDKEGGGIVGVTSGLSSKFGDLRVRSTPISEQAIIGAAIGASLGGYRPVAELMLMNFSTVAMDMLTNHAAKLRYMSGGQTHVPIVVRTATGCGFGNGGQHSDYLEAWFAHTPGIKVVAPTTPADAYGLLRSSIEDDDPVMFIENIPLYFAPGPLPAERAKVPLGNASIRRAGTDVTLVAHSRMVPESLAAAEALAAAGISAEVIDLRTIVPWDRETVMKSVARTRRAVVVHEAVKAFGIGAEIAAEISDELFGTLRGPVKRLGAPYAPVPFAKALEDIYAPNRNTIADAVKRLVG